MRALLPVLCLALLCHAAPALAQECDESDETQTGMNICAGVAYKAADRKLNEAYGKVVAHLKDSPEDRKLLQAAQRAWIAFRDAECAFSGNGYAGGSMQPMVVSMCLTDLTETRTKQLDAYLQPDL